MLSHESMVAEEAMRHNFAQSTVDHPLIDILLYIFFFLLFHAKFSPLVCLNHLITYFD